MTLAILFVTAQTFSFAANNVPAPLQVALFYKIFQFDGNLTESDGVDIKIGIFYNPDNSQSKTIKDEIIYNFTKLSARKIGDRSISIVELTDIDQIKDIHVIYVAPGNDAFIKAIVEKCNKYKILGISGVEEYTQQGLAIAIGLKDQKPVIIINKTAAELSGAKLSSKIMVLAQII